MSPRYDDSKLDVCPASGNDDIITILESIVFRNFRADTFYYQNDRNDNI